MEKKALVGRHLSIAGGIELSVARAVAVEATCFQIFSRSSRFANLKQYSEIEIEAFQSAQKRTGIDVVVAHAPYLINLASTTEKTRHNSYVLLRAELLRAQSLQFYCVVLHPGSHNGEGEDIGVERVAQALNKLFEEIPGDVPIALETMAGQGSSLGSTLQSLKNIYDKCSNKQRVRFCLDTCHIFVAGYDISSGDKFRAFLDEFDRVLGLSNVAVIHCNDSQSKYGSRLDRHARLGKGTIPMDVFEQLMNEPRLKHIPKILESPDEPGEEEVVTYRNEIRMLRSLERK